MKKFFKKNYKYIIVIFAISIVMTFFMTKKEGFHEDEMFSYGSSNYAYDNVYRPYGKEDETNIFVKEKIMNDNIIQNLKYYLIHYIFFVLYLIRFLILLLFFQIALQLSFYLIYQYK